MADDRPDPRVLARIPTLTEVVPDPARESALARLRGTAPEPPAEDDDAHFLDLSDLLERSERKRAAKVEAEPPPAPAAGPRTAATPTPVAPAVGPVGPTRAVPATASAVDPLAYRGRSAPAPVAPRPPDPRATGPTVRAPSPPAVAGAAQAGLRLAASMPMPSQDAAAPAVVRADIGKGPPTLDVDALFERLAPGLEDLVRDAMRDAQFAALASLRQSVRPLVEALVQDMLRQTARDLSPEPVRQPAQPGLQGQAEPTVSRTPREGQDRGA